MDRDLAVQGGGASERGASFGGLQREFRAPFAQFGTSFVPVFIKLLIIERRMRRQFSPTNIVPFNGPTLREFCQK